MINTGLFSSKTNEWATPKALFEELDKEFHFNLDPCATPENAKCKRFYTIEDDGLIQDWGGVSCILQPSLWEGDRQVGKEMLRRELAMRGCGYAHSGKNGHVILP